MATQKQYLETIQTWGAKRAYYHASVDGLVGPETLKLLAAYATYFPGRAAKLKTPFASLSQVRKIIAFAQTIFAEAGIDTGAIDGYAGAQTDWAFDQYSVFAQTGNLPEPTRDDVEAAKPFPPSPPKASIFPLQRDVEKFYGKIGENQTKLITPYPLRVAYNPSQIIHAFNIHEKCHDTALAAMEKVASEWSLEEIRANGFDLWGGCYNPRRMRNGVNWSMHAWAIAIDWDTARNALNVHKPKAQFSKEPGLTFLRIWESVGWTSLGLQCDYDYMHVQAARLK